jgi:hypothetical protein
MSTRVKLSSSSVSYYYEGQFQYTSTNDYVRENMSEERVSNGSTNVRHFKVLSARNGFLGYQQPWDTFYCRNHAVDLRNYTLPVSIGVLRDKAYHNMLDAGLNPNDFELLTFLADIDGTIAMFTRKFLSDLNYGSVNWGVLPFVSDIKALIGSIKDIFRRMNGEFSSCSRLNRKREIVYESRAYEVPPYGNPNHRENDLLIGASGTCRANGVLTWNPPPTEPLDKALLLLDELGVHPDLKTLWDVIPLSFIVDYFIPIGDILESIHPRGWGSVAYTFSGYLSTKALLEIGDVYWVNGTQRKAKSTCIVSYYERTRYDGYIPSSVDSVEWEAPSMRELFNVAYLSSFIERFTNSVVK